MMVREKTIPRTPLPKKDVPNYIHNFGKYKAPKSNFHLRKPEGPRWKYNGDCPHPPCHSCFANDYRFHRPDSPKAKPPRYLYQHYYVSSTKPIG